MSQSRDNDQERLPQPATLILDTDKVVREASEWLAKSRHEPEEAKRIMRREALTSPRFGLIRTNRLAYLILQHVADSLRPETDPSPNNSLTKTEAFMMGGSIGSLAVAYHFDYRIPVLTEQACEAYALQPPEQSETTRDTMSTTANTSIDAGIHTYRANPAIEQLIDVVGGGEVSTEPGMMQAGAGYVVYLIGYAAAYAIYENTQKQLSVFIQAHGEDMSGVLTEEDERMLLGEA